MRKLFALLLFPCATLIRAGETFLLIFLLFAAPVFAQHGQGYAFYRISGNYDSAQAALKTNLSDTARMAAYHELGFYLVGSKLDSSLYFFDQELILARKLRSKLWEADALDFTGFVLWRLLKYPGALQRFLTGIKIAEDPASEGANWGLAR